MQTSYWVVLLVCVFIASGVELHSTVAFDNLQLQSSIIFTIIVYFMTKKYLDDLSVKTNKSTDEIVGKGTRIYENMGKLIDGTNSIINISRTSLEAAHKKWSAINNKAGGLLTEINGEISKQIDAAFPKAGKLDIPATGIPSVEIYNPLYGFYDVDGSWNFVDKNARPKKLVDFDIDGELDDVEGETNNKISSIRKGAITGMRNSMQQGTEAIFTVVNKILTALQLPSPIEDVKKIIKFDEISSLLNETGPAREASPSTFALVAAENINPITALYLFTLLAWLFLFFAAPFLKLLSKTVEKFKNSVENATKRTLAAAFEATRVSCV